MEMELFQWRAFMRFAAGLNCNAAITKESFAVENLGEMLRVRLGAKAGTGFVHGSAKFIHSGANKGKNPLPACGKWGWRPRIRGKARVRASQAVGKICGTQ
jgi:hypothetical protein